jgi:membrane protein
MKEIVTKVQEFWATGLWEIPLRDAPGWRRFLVSVPRFACKMAAEFQRGQLPTRASALVYTTLLTLVPFLAVSFSLLKSLGVHNMMEPVLAGILEPLGDRSAEITSSIILYVDKMNVGLLGSIGLFMLVYTVISTVQQIEDALNYLWHIGTSRTFFRKMRDYLSVVLVGPVLVVAAVGVGASLMSNAVVNELKSREIVGTTILFIGKMSPFILISLSFTMIYYMLPNTKVRFLSAFAGGVSAGTLWVVGGAAFASFVASSVHYSAIYSGFAIVILLMMWLYYNWLILLTGAKVSFYHQFPGLLALRDETAIHGDAFRQRQAVLVMWLISSHYFLNKQRWTADALKARLGLPAGLVEVIVTALERHSLIVKAGDDDGFIPARDTGTITVLDVMKAVAAPAEPVDLFAGEAFSAAAIDGLFDQFEKTRDATFGEKTVRDLMTSGVPAPATIISQQSTADNRKDRTSGQ